MAEPNLKDTELDTVALDIYIARSGMHSPAQAEAVVVDSYRKASAFLAVKKKLREKGIDAAIPPEPEGADCRAPNLKPMHVHNLVARNGGNLPLVNRIKKWLDANPTPERDPEELLNKLNRAFPELGWDLPTVNVARQVFPVYATS